MIHRITERFGCIRGRNALPIRAANFTIVCPFKFVTFTNTFLSLPLVVRRVMHKLGLCTLAHVVEEAFGWYVE
jgi:hypothetical protein